MSTVSDTSSVPRPLPMGMTDESRSHGHFSGQQLALLASLEQLDLRFGAMYRGTLQVLQSDNVNKYALAAHGLRELIEKLPQHFNLRMQAHNEQLGAEVDNACSAWEKARDNSTCTCDGRWIGEIDDHLRKCLSTISSFFERFRANAPRRRQEVAELIHTMDPGRGRLPKELEEPNVKIVQSMRAYFTKISHHRETPDSADFFKWLDEFERFLLDRLRPRTFEDQDLIDAVIAEGESHG